VSRRLGVGLLGVGWMGALHTRAYRRLADHYPDLDVRCELVAAADVGESGRRRAVEELGYARAEQDWRAVVDDPDVDVVSVTAPNALHREMALAVLAAGKALWVEKPVGRGLAETAEVAAALDPGAVTAVGFNYRTVPLVEHAGAALLGRKPGWPPGRFSTLAGFVEPGETLEDAVRREVFEESGARVTACDYHSSQPWPFPASLMLGFRAQAASRALGPGDGELAELRWIERGQMRAGLTAGTLSLPPAYSVAQRLIRDWLDDDATR